MQIYFVSTQDKLLFNAGLIKSSHSTYESAFDKAEAGQYIHSITVDEVVKIIPAGKMAKRVM